MIPQRCRLQKRRSASWRVLRLATLHRRVHTAIVLWSGDLLSISRITQHPSQRSRRRNIRNYCPSQPQSIQRNRLKKAISARSFSQVWVGRLELDWAAAQRVVWTLSKRRLSPKELA